MWFEEISLSPQQQELKVKHLTIQLETIRKQINKSFEQLGVTEEELDQYLDNKDNFTEEVWQILQTCKSDLEEKLDLAMSNITTKSQLSQAYQEMRERQKHWIPVR